jgi:hypothetical protein
MSWDDVYATVGGQLLSIQEICFNHYLPYKEMKPIWEKDQKTTARNSRPDHNKLHFACQTVVGVWGAVHDMKGNEQFKREAIQAYVNLGTTLISTDAMSNIADFIGFGVDKTIEYIDAFKAVAKKEEYQKYSMEQKHLMDSVHQPVTVAKWAAGLMDAADYGMMELSNNSGKSSSVTQVNLNSMVWYATAIRQRLYVYRKQCKDQQLQVILG